MVHGFSYDSKNKENKYTVKQYKTTIKWDTFKHFLNMLIIKYALYTVYITFKMSSFFFKNNTFLIRC